MTDDPGLALASGRVTRSSAMGDRSAVNKFGHAPAVQSTFTDLWDRANAVDTQYVWTPPTTARVHNIVSSSATDDAASTGAKTVRVWGLTSWNTAEEFEDITMDGTTAVPTTKSWVAIHRLECILWGSSGPNVGIITATAVTDATVTAQIGAAAGQTQMAIYAIPRGQIAYMRHSYAALDKSSGPTVSTDLRLAFNPIPDIELLGYLHKEVWGLNHDGTSFAVRPYWPPKKFKGPGILKMMAAASAAAEVSGGFDLVLEDGQ